MDEHSPPRRGRGQPPWQPTDKERAEAEALAGVGLPHEQIAAILGVDDKTLRKHLHDELKHGKAIATAKVAKTLFEKAVNDRDTASLIFWMKSQAGWSEKSQIEHIIKRNASELSDDELASIASRGGAGVAETQDDTEGPAQVVH